MMLGCYIHQDVDAKVESFSLLHCKVTLFLFVINMFSGKVFWGHALPIISANLVRLQIFFTLFPFNKICELGDGKNK